MSKVGTDYNVGDKVTSPWLPNGGTISQGFGTLEYIPSLGLNQTHEGIDIGATRGDPIISPVAATVIGAGWDDFGGGNFVHLDLGDGTTVFLFHMQDVAVKMGQTISPNELLGHIDSTGKSTGDHLHFQVDQGGIPVDPWNWINGILGGSSAVINKSPANPLDALKNVNDFFGHFVNPGHDTCSPPADENALFKVIDSLTCSRNWWRAIFVMVGIGMIGTGVVIYFFKEESAAVQVVAKEGGEAAALAA